MERKIESAIKHLARQGSGDQSARPAASSPRPIIALGAVDQRSVVVAALCGAGYFGFALACLALSRFDSTLASVWIPNAFAVSVLLLARLRNELLSLGSIAAACVMANTMSGNSLTVSSCFALANVCEIVLVVWLIRKQCGDRPDMADLGDLGRFLQIAGFVGPATAALVATPGLAIGKDAFLSGTVAWFLADSMGMILIVPAVLLLADLAEERKSWLNTAHFEAVTLMLGGLLAVYFVFRQDVYPLLFLAPPVTLLIAFRIGAVGTAIFVPLIAVVASWLTYIGVGPIVNNSTSELDKTYLIQAFTAVNYLTGLPIAAILAGRVRLVEELERGRNEVALLADHITDAVLKLDRDGVCTYASPSVEDVLGRPPEDLTGRIITAHIHEEANQHIAGVLERLLGGVSVKERLTYRRLLDGEAGTAVFIEADCAAVIDPDTGERDGIVVSARDVTDRVELELLLTRARATAENAAQAKSEFLANMSHEIRTPMNGVLGFAELMLRGELDEQTRRYTEMIVQSGRSMMMLLNDILDLSKIEAGQITIDHQPVDLHATIAECAALHRATAEKKGLDLQFRIAPDRSAASDGPQQWPNPWIITDGLRLRQIMLNLVANAVKFTQQGRVEIACETDDEKVVISVIDSGIGINADRLESIFAPFTQAESDTSRRFGGTGLGLTISRQIAQLLGGTIDVRSTPGVGSTFSVTLPALYTEPLDTGRDVPDVVQPAELPQSARILLVEDHDVNRTLAQEMLEHCGQSVASAHDGNEAIAMVIDSVMRGRPYDLVLMDIQMPGCDGYVATRAIRAEGIGPDVLPIVALTANAFPEDIAAARKAGMQGHLAKPLAYSELVRTLRRWLPTRIVEQDERVDQVRAANWPPARERRAERQQTGRPELARPYGGPKPTPDASALRMSPALRQRWALRRSEAVEAVRSALEGGDLSGEELSLEACDTLAQLLHKLAGTAGMFGEARLGERASEFERALRQPMAADVLQDMAYDLLDVAGEADSPHARTGT